MKLGAEPKKLIILGVLVVVAGGIFLMNRQDQPEPPRRPAGSATKAVPSGESQPGPAATKRTGQPDPGNTPPPSTKTSRSRGSTRAGLQDFRPVLRPKRQEDRLDPTSVDPTLRLELLARLQTVKSDQVGRSLFEFSAAPVVAKAPDPPKIAVKPVSAETKPSPTEPVKPVDPPKPKAPPIAMKFYGVVAPQRQGVKRAFFLDGEDIHVASEGELIKKRYKVVRINVNSVVMEDTQFQGDQQTLPLEEPPANS